MSRIGYTNQVVYTAPDSWGRMMQCSLCQAIISDTKKDQHTSWHNELNALWQEVDALARGTSIPAATTGVSVQQSGEDFIVTAPQGYSGNITKAASEAIAKVFPPGVATKVVLNPPPQHNEPNQRGFWTTTALPSQNQQRIAQAVRILRQLDAGQIEEVKFPYSTVNLLLAHGLLEANVYSVIPVGTTSETFIVRLKQPRQAFKPEPTPQSEPPKPKQKQKLRQPPRRRIQRRD